MRTLIHVIHTSLDGRICGPNGEFDWPQMGPEMSAWSTELNDRIDTLLYGRVVWGWMAAYWPTADQDTDDAHDKAYAPLWRETDKVVVSRTLDDVSLPRTTLLRDVADVAALKEKPGGDIVLMGGASLAASVAAAGLLDELQIAVHPVVLGGDNAVLPAGRLGFSLVGSEIKDGRVVVSTYRSSR